MRQDQQAPTAQSVITYHMKEAENQGDMKAMEGHKLVLLAILAWVEKNT